VSVTLSAVLAGSTAVVTTPALNTLTEAVSGDFAAPVAGYYALGVALTGTATASTAAVVRATLMARQV
jgi:hypothetical protein